MARRYAKGSRAWGECQRSGKRLLLKDMVTDGQIPNLLVAPDWFEPKHPQERMISAGDSSALYRPAPENDDDGDVIFTFPAVEDITFQVIPNPFFGWDADNAPGYSVAAGPVVLTGNNTLNASVANSTTDFPVVVPTVSDGDVILFVISVPGSGSPIPPAITANTTGVRTLSRSTGNTNENPFPNLQFTSLFWKRWTTGDPTTYNFRHNQGAARRMYADTYVFRNVSVKQPFDNFAFRVTSANSQKTTISPMPQVSSAASMVFEGWTFAETALGAATPISAIKPLATLTGSIDAIVVDQLSARIGWRRFGCYTLAADTTTNLLTYSGPSNFNNWATVGATVSQVDVNEINAEVLADGTTGEHGIYQDVTLTAGQSYCLAVSWCGNSNNDQIFFGVRDTTSTWNGQIVQYKTAPGTARSTQNIGGGFTSVIEVKDEDGASDAPTQTYCYFTASVTGTHRVGLLNVSGVQPAATISFTGTGQVLLLNMVCFAASGTAAPSFRYTNGAAVSAPSLTENGYQNRTAISLNAGGTFGATNSANAFVLEILGNSQVHATLMEHPYGKIQGMHVDSNRRGAGNTFGNKVFAKDNAAGGGLEGVVVGRIQFPNGQMTAATGKYYVECTFGAKLGGIANTEIGLYLGSVGVPCPGADGLNNGEPGNGSPFGTLTSMGYDAGGSVRVNGGTTAVATFTTGDTIGAAVDYTAGTVAWYKNGALQTTSTMTALFLEHPCQVGAYCGGGGTGRSILVTFKMRSSEFSFTKPSGFQDWDWLSQ